VALPGLVEIAHMLNIFRRALRALRHWGKQALAIDALRLAAHRARFARGEEGGVSGIYPTLEDAARAIPPSKPVGYDNTGSAEMYRDRLDRIYPADYPVLFWLSRVLPGAQVVFDFGGHVGLQFHAYRRYLAFPDRLRWVVCDVPAVCAAGERLAAERGAGGLGFTTRFEEADGSSVLLAAGSLQYLPHGYLAERLAGLRALPAHLLVNKLPVHPDRAYATIQDIGPAFQPYAVFARQAFVDGLRALGYELVDAWENAELSCRIPYQPAYDVPAYSGYYFRRAGTPHGG
jgi:putative methyltransferase (TIGR04325 family)